jgi:hypothetical protein
MALGLAGVSFNNWALWRIIGLIGGKAESKRPRWGAWMTVLAFFVKLPIVIAAGFLALSLGSASMTCFLVGLGLVYCALLGWAIARGEGPP